MMKFLKNILTSPKNSTEILQTDTQSKLEIAACVLLVEIGKADGSFTDPEKDKIISIMKSTFNLQEDYINELIELSEKRIEENDSIYEFTTIINKNFSNQEKVELVKNLWRIIYTDNILDKYEEHVVKKIGILLNIDYSSIISGKLIVKEEMKK